jgi:ABC-2 type transport system ATP-binding protein
MRMILGLDLPTSGTVTVDGRRYQGTVWPLHEVGALLDVRAVHPGRSAYDPRRGRRHVSRPGRPGHPTIIG